MSGLIRVLTQEESRHPNGGCAFYWRGSEWEEGCDAVALLRLATPHGEQDFCRDHIDYMIAALPPEWIEGFAYRQPPTEDASDDIPF